MRAPASLTALAISIVSPSVSTLQGPATTTIVRSPMETEFSPRPTTTRVGSAL